MAQQTLFTPEVAKNYTDHLPEIHLVAPLQLLHNCITRLETALSIVRKDIEAVENEGISPPIELIEYKKGCEATMRRYRIALQKIIKP